jgi:hypothetical protein
MPIARRMGAWKPGAHRTAAKAVPPDRHKSQAAQGEKGLWKRSARLEAFSLRHERRDNYDFVALLVPALWPARSKV